MIIVKINIQFLSQMYKIPFHELPGALLGGRIFLVFCLCLNILIILLLLVNQERSSLQIIYVVGVLNFVAGASLFTSVTIMSVILARQWDIISLVFISIFVWPYKLDEGGSSIYLQTNSSAYAMQFETDEMFSDTVTYTFGSCIYIGWSTVS